MSLANQFAAYTAWRSRLSSHVGEFQGWLNKNELSDGQTDLRLTQLLERLREDRLNVAFVAEFSRGKSELINAIFFADYGNRMLPSSAGRTTMCPTELLFDASKQPCIELLPIQTRATNSGVTEYKSRGLGYRVAGCHAGRAAPRQRNHSRGAGRSRPPGF